MVDDTAIERKSMSYGFGVHQNMKYLYIGIVIVLDDLVARPWQQPQKGKLKLSRLQNFRDLAI